MTDWGVASRKTGITRRHQRLVDSAMEQIIRALQLPADQTCGLHLHHREGCGRQRRMQFIISQ